MKDNKKIIEIDENKYLIDRTYDGSPAIYQHIENGCCHHINSFDSQTHISSIVAGKQDFVIILARKV